MKRITKSVTATAGLLAAGLLLGGCVYGPDYSYVRGDGYNGDAYYGTGYSGGGYYGGSYYGAYPGYYGWSSWGYPYYGYGIYYYDSPGRHHHDRPRNDGHGGGWRGGRNGQSPPSTAPSPSYRAPVRASSPPPVRSSRGRR